MGGSLLARVRNARRTRSPDGISRRHHELRGSHDGGGAWYFERSRNRRASARQRRGDTQAQSVHGPRQRLEPPDRAEQDGAFDTQTAPVIKRAHQSRASGAPDQALDLDTAQEERRKLLWACMFTSVFRYNDFAGIRKVATNAMSDMYNIAVKYFDEYTQFVDQQAEQSMPQEYRWGKPGETMSMKQMWMDKTRGEMLTSASFLNPPARQPRLSKVRAEAGNEPVV